jgi:hypothetical protein
LASANTNVQKTAPDVAAAAANAAEARNRLGSVTVEGQVGVDVKAESVAAPRDGPPNRPDEVQPKPDSSLTIEKSGITRYNSVKALPVVGSQRENVAARGWVRLGVAAVVLLAALGCAMWVLRSKIFH